MKTKQNKLHQPGFEEEIEQLPLTEKNDKPEDKRRSKIFEAALDAVENMHKPVKH